MLVDHFQRRMKADGGKEGGKKKKYQYNGQHSWMMTLAFAYTHVIWQGASSHSHANLRVNQKFYLSKSQKTQKLVSVVNVSPTSQTPFSCGSGTGSLAVVHGVVYCTVSYPFSVLARACS